VGEVEEVEEVEEAGRDVLWNVPIEGKKFCIVSV
jgi:hypothetical protein